MVNGSGMAVPICGEMATGPCRYMDIRGPMVNGKDQEADGTGRLVTGEDNQLPFYVSCENILIILFLIRN